MVYCETSGEVTGTDAAAVEARDGVGIDQVVDDVDRAGDQAEQDKSAQGMPESGPMEKLFVKDKRKKDESILRPLARTHGFEQGF